MNETEYKNLLPGPFQERFDAAPLAYLPVGSLEWHGEHMALGNDGIKVEELCKAAARTGGGIVLPCAFVGIRGMTGWSGRYRVGGRGIFSVRRPLLRGLLRAQIENLERIGFRAAVVITGHYPQEQVDLVREVADSFNARPAAKRPGNRLRAAGITDRNLAREVDHTGDHAAKWETSILMALRPELVEMSRLPGDPSERPYGVYGDDPRLHASPELGRRVVEAMVGEMCALGRSLLEESLRESRTG